MTPLQQLREFMGMRSGPLAEALGIHKTNLLKIEQGRQSPRKETARQIYDFFGGFVPLGLIYDATHPSFRRWFDEKAQTEAAKLAKRLRRRYPQLRDV